MRTNQAARSIIQKYEGFSLVSYPDPFSDRGNELRKPLEKRSPNYQSLSGEPWTIGIGETGPDVVEGLTWTVAQVYSRFERRLLLVESQLGKCVHVPLNDNQFSALVSFTFNVGIGKLLHAGPNEGISTLLEKLNDGDYLGAAEEFVKWDHSRGQVIPGLLSRRTDEQALFLLS